MTELVKVDKTKAKELLRANASRADHDDDDSTVGTVIHTFSAGAVMLGADWDVEEAVRFADDADELAWVDHPLEHDLAIRSRGRVVFFDVRDTDRRDAAT